MFHKFVTGICVVLMFGLDMSLPDSWIREMIEAIDMSDYAAHTLDGEDMPPPESMLPNGDVMLWRGEKWMFDCINWHRARAGLRPFVVSRRALNRCRRHCIWMARCCSMTHSGRGGENIACGQSNAKEAVQVWVNKDAHAVQIFSRHWTKVAVACYQMPNGQKYYCMECTN